MYQRPINNKAAVESMKVVVNHKITNNDVLTYFCESDMEVGGKCAFCSTIVKRIVPGTATGHVFVDYKVSDEATCQRGDIEKAKCSHSWCSKEDARTLENKTYHLFTTYAYDNNATCVSGGTNSASCDFGCGAVDVIAATVQTSGHRYVYTKNNDATLVSNMTETGVCSQCGATNIRTVAGSRLTRVMRIDVEISTATTRQIGLPTINATSEGIDHVSTTWQNSGGVTFNGDDQDVVLKNDETYELKTLVIAVDNEHALHDTVELYVNGVLFSGHGVIEGKAITFRDVGQFKF